ncbi:MAG: hypothetical protein ABIW84_00395, partial [Ilumatobacteraceae bacterium]
PERTNANTKIQLVDIFNKTVYTENAVMNSGALQKTIIPPPTLANGLYIVRLIVNDKIYITQLVYEK